MEGNDLERGGWSWEENQSEQSAQDVGSYLYTDYLLQTSLKLNFNMGKVEVTGNLIVLHI